MKEKIVEEKIEALIKVKFLGSFKEFMSGEVYEMEASEAAPYVILGYARLSDDRDL